MRFVVASLNLCLAVVFAYAAVIYLAGAGLDRSPDALEGCIWALYLFTDIPLIILGICFLFCVPEPQKYMPWIGLFLLFWEPQGGMYNLFAQTLRPVLPYGIGAAIAAACCLVTVWQGLSLYRRSARVLSQPLKEMQS